MLQLLSTGENLFMTLKNRIFHLWVLIFILLTFFQTSVFAKDEWIMVQSKNFKMIGNASDKDIRKVATKLEQFREVFRSIFAGVNFASIIPTNVIVFKNNSAYKPFKPIRADGKIDDFVAGFFQGGEDVNYITLSTDGEDVGTFEVIFHEYVHFLVNTNIGKSNVPPWFNEGLAEYYETFAMEQDKTAKLGIFKQNHINLLSQTKLVPLETLFSVSNYGLLQQGGHSRSIFYAESWALIHYLIQTGKSAGLSNFLLSTMKNTPSAQVFQDSFQMSYAQMEKELSKYFSQNSYKYQIIDFKNKLLFENQMQTTPLSEAESNAYLGDLLFHNHRVDDAEPFLQKSIALDPKQSAAYTTLGMVRFRQGKFDEAKTYLEKAVSDDQKNAIALYYYAFALSRESADSSNLYSRFSAESASKIREALKKSIALNPTFGGSYDLLAFISLVTGENMDEAVQLLGKALAIEPGNQKYALRIAEIYSRQEKFDQAKLIAEKIANTSDDPETKSRAEFLKENIQRNQTSRAEYEAARKRYEESSKNGGGGGGREPMLNRQVIQADKQLTPEEVTKLQEEAKMLSINQALRKPETGEKQVIGHISKITCAGGKVTYSVKSETETFALFSKDFQNLILTSIVEGTENAEFGCNANVGNINMVITFKDSTPTKPGVKGELVALDFVPNNFKFIN